MGQTILPNTFAILSTTTISTYISDSQREAFKNIMRVVAYFGLGLQIYFMATSGKFVPNSQ